MENNPYRSSSYDTSYSYDDKSYDKSSYSMDLTTNNHHTVTVMTRVPTLWILTRNNHHTVTAYDKSSDLWILTTNNHHTVTVMTRVLLYGF